MIVKPSLQGLWLAENVKNDPETGKLTYVNVFDCITVKTSRMAYQQPSVLFFGLRNLRGPVQLLLEYIDLANHSALITRKISIEGNDPHHMKFVALELPTMPVPHPGPYLWKMSCAYEEIGAARITADIEQD